MRRLCALALIAALGAALVVSETRAQSSVIPIYLDASGNKQVPRVGVGTPIAEQFPERNMKLIQPVALQAIFWRRLTSSAQQTTNGYRFVDSTQFLPAAGYRMLGIIIYPTFQDSVGATEGTYGASFAMEVRTSATATADSQSTYIVGDKYRALTSGAVDFSKPDSLGSLLDFFANNPARVESDTVVRRDQMILNLANVAGPNRGRLYYLTHKDGTPYRGDNVQLWFKILHSYCDVTGAPVGPVYCEPGGAIADAANANGRKVRLRVDFVGWM